MPHCIIEHSAALDAERILPLVFSGAMESGLFEPDGSDIKIRTMTYHHYLTGAKHSDFIHVALKILSGRSPEQKKMLSLCVLSALKTLDIQTCSLTVEVVDIERNSYSKWCR